MSEAIANPVHRACPVSIQRTCIIWNANGWASSHAPRTIPGQSAFVIPDASSQEFPGFERIFTPVFHTHSVRRGKCATKLFYGAPDRIRTCGLCPREGRAADVLDGRQEPWKLAPACQEGALTDGWLSHRVSPIPSALISSETNLTRTESRAILCLRSKHPNNLA